MLVNFFKGFFLLYTFVDGKGVEHAKILQWWNDDVSEQKPVKCKISPCYFEHHHPITSNLIKEKKSTKIIESRYCNALDSKFLVHSFRGKKVNGQLEGNVKSYIWVQLEKATHGLTFGLFSLPKAF